MKKRNVLLSLVLTLALCLGSTIGVSANTLDVPDESKMEEVTYTFHNDVVKGGYKLISTEELDKKVQAGTKMVIVDTMPANATPGIVPGAVNAVAGSGAGADAYVWQDGQKANLIKVVNADLKAKGLTKKVAVYGKWVKCTKTAYNKVTIKACKRIIKVKGKKVYQKRTRTYNTVVDKSAPIVVYCGFIGCARSHIAAAYLKSQGYTNVSRYGGGILAWRDAGKTMAQYE